MSCINTNNSNSSIEVHHNQTLAERRRAAYIYHHTTAHSMTACRSIPQGSMSYTQGAYPSRSVSTMTTASATNRMLNPSNTTLTATIISHRSRSLHSSIHAFICFPSQHHRRRQQQRRLTAACVASRLCKNVLANSHEKMQRPSRFRSQSAARRGLIARALALASPVPRRLLSRRRVP